jgi:signal transduction histidine kinase
MRILSNLVSNSIRNTEAGRVLLGCRREGKNVRILVCDTGVGMEPNAISALMECEARKGAYIGNGLGLGIVRELCDAHGFELQVSSNPGHGTCVSVTLQRADTL